MRLFWTIRKWILAALSRNFWLGVGVGFFFASMFYANMASAAYIDSSTGTYTSWCGVASFSSKMTTLVSATSTAMQMYRSGAEIGTDNCYFSRMYTPPSLLIATSTTIHVLYDVVRTSGSCVLIIDRGVGYSTHSIAAEIVVGSTVSNQVYSFQNGSPYYGYSVGLRNKASTPSNCTLYVKRIYDSDGNDYFNIYDTDTIVVGDGDSGSTGTTTVEEVYYGDTTFGIAILIVLQFLMFAGFLYKRSVPTQ